MITGPPGDLRAGWQRAQQIAVVLMLTLALHAYTLNHIAKSHAPFGGFTPTVPIGALRVVLAVLALANLLVLKIVTLYRLTSAPGVAVTRRSSSVAQRLFTVSIVRLAICETVAISGVVLFLMGGRWADFYAFAIVSLGAFVFPFPRLAQWEDWARQLPA